MNVISTNKNLVNWLSTILSTVFIKVKIGDKV